MFAAPFADVCVRAVNRICKELQIHGKQRRQPQLTKAKAMEEAQASLLQEIGVLVEEQQKMITIMPCILRVFM
jgi:hypothetical protein